MSENGSNGAAKDITFPARLLPALHGQMQTLFSLQPPPPPRGKYFFAKIAQKVAAELPLYNQQRFELLKKHAPLDEKGEPVLLVTDFGNGQSEVKIHPIDQAAFNTEDAELGSTPIVLAGIPLLTHAELGDCPIPQGAYTLMLGVLIKDEPPE
jgi:hypothetical protein